MMSSKHYKSSVSAPIIKIGIGAIALGMIVMLISVATSAGLQREIRNKIIAYKGHITISHFDGNRSDESLLPLDLTDLLLRQLDSVEGISSYYFEANKFGIVRTENDFEGVVFKGLDKQFDWDKFNGYLLEGRLPVVGDSLTNEILISQYLSNRLGLRTGDPLFMYFLREDENRPPAQRKFDIVGVINSGFQDLDATYLLGDLRHVQILNKWTPNQVGEIVVMAGDFDQLDLLNERIYQNISFDLDSRTVVQQHAEIFEWISIFDQNTQMILVIMILVAGINMVTALLVLILERTPMIGLLRALGGQSHSLQKIFLLNAAHLIGWGLLFGNLIGLSLLFIQQFFGVIPLDPSVYYVTEVPIHLNFFHWIYLNLGVFVLSMLMLLIPSNIVRKVSPVTAMGFR
ncbi:MAG: ABC transporter permease [Bacteroidetes bacterium]|jgi:lipoprotein-releasing system permease protein|nr:ABC transporter permease [Bacteroidota bacterium]MDA0880048.1 ABC transporter permease [Bacteroidota bacterium]MDA1115956.1 ABC transporter permease [Bacteroidota bacterium]